MVGPGVTPESGVTQYFYDRTQGPACALVCPAALVFRNYFVNRNGQTASNQLDGLDAIGTVSPPPSPRTPVATYPRLPVPLALM